MPGCKRHEKTQLFPVNHPFIEVECEGVVERTGHIVHMENNPIFPHAILTLQVVCNVKIVGLLKRKKFVLWKCVQG